MLASKYMEADKREYGRSRPGIWTLASEEVWRSTHRASGPVFVVAGIATLIAALVATSMPTVTFAVMLISVLGATAFAGVYSYLQWRKLAA